MSNPSNGGVGKRGHGLDALTVEHLSNAGSDLSQQHEVVHYLYFPRRANALRASKELAAVGYDVEVRRTVDGSDWLVLAKGAVVPQPVNIAKMRHQLEALAARFDGDYDGWEAAVAPGSGDS